MKNSSHFLCSFTVLKLFIIWNIIYNLLIIIYLSKELNSELYKVGTIKYRKFIQIESPNGIPVSNAAYNISFLPIAFSFLLFHENPWPSYFLPSFVLLPSPEASWITAHVILCPVLQYYFTRILSIHNSNTSCFCNIKNKTKNSQ